MRKLLACAFILFATLSAAHAQTGCTVKTQAQNLTALSDGQASGSITPGVIRNFVCSAQPVIRVVTAAGAITAATTDQLIEVNKTVGAATTVNMPSCAANANLQLTIIDGKGDASTNNITLTPSAGTINGSSTFIMNVNRQQTTVYYDGSQCLGYP